MKDIRCPYCGYIKHIDLSEEASGYLLNEDKIYTNQCDFCGKEYEYRVIIQIALRIIKPEDDYE